MGDKYIEQAQDAAWTEYERFKKDYELSLKNNKAFPDIVKDIMDREKLTIEKLVNKSLLDRQTINRFRTGKIKTKTRVMDYVPSMRSIIAFCIACNMDMLNTVTLLESLGLTFRRTQVHEGRQGHAGLHRKALHARRGHVLGSRHRQDPAVFVQRRFCAAQRSGARCRLRRKPLIRCAGARTPAQSCKTAHTK